jgi:predicted  nucleic acid-binding Zn-ribbon protein
LKKAEQSQKELKHKLTETQQQLQTQTAVASQVQHRLTESERQLDEYLVERTQLHQRIEEVEKQQASAVVSSLASLEDQDQISPLPGPPSSGRSRRPRASSLADELGEPTLAPPGSGASPNPSPKAAGGVAATVSVGAQANSQVSKELEMEVGSLRAQVGELQNQIRMQANRLEISDSKVAEASRREKEAKEALHRLDREVTRLKEENGTLTEDNAALEKKLKHAKKKRAQNIVAEAEASAAVAFVCLGVAASLFSRFFSLTFGICSAVLFTIFHLELFNRNGLSISIASRCISSIFQTDCAHNWHTQPRRLDRQRRSIAVRARRIRSPRKTRPCTPASSNLRTDASWSW